MIFSSNIHFQIIKFVRYFIEIICKASVNIVGETDKHASYFFLKLWNFKQLDVKP